MVPGLLAFVTGALVSRDAPGVGRQARLSCSLKLQGDALAHKLTSKNSLYCRLRWVLVARRCVQKGTAVGRKHEQVQSTKKRRLRARRGLVEKQSNKRNYYGCSSSSSSSAREPTSPVNLTYVQSDCCDKNVSLPSSRHPEMSCSSNQLQSSRQRHGAFLVFENVSNLLILLGTLRSYKTPNIPSLVARLVLAPAYCHYLPS